MKNHVDVLSPFFSEEGQTRHMNKLSILISGLAIFYSVMCNVFVHFFKEINDILLSVIFIKNYILMFVSD
jgi:hypothetical protein